MRTIKYFDEEIEKLKERNKLVEANKAWETSWTRRILIFVLTYITVSLFFLFANLPNPFVNSIIPALAFLLSTLTIPAFKKLWLRYIYKK